MVREDIAMGHLIKVLPDCSTSDSGVEVCLFYSHRELLPVRFRTFVDFCTEFFRADGSAREADAGIVAPRLVEHKTLVLAAV
jgi:DNA-binding transcriptional LysR family regulator